jgi:hypothetical protein
VCQSRGSELKIYRDPFAEQSAPGRWPAITMHSECFLAYIRDRKSAAVGRQGALPGARRVSAA